MARDDPVLQLHLEPQEPIEIEELTGALGALARQYQDFAISNHLAERAGEARLLVSNVAPGSIDISLLPEWVVVAGPLLAPLIDKASVILKFAEKIKELIQKFSGEKGAPADATLKDCDDAINLVKPVAEHGGVQNFNIVQHQTIINNVLTTDTRQARRVTQNAARKKAELQASSQPERRERVAMIWSRLEHVPAE
jgi:hypothetical protein